MVERRTAEFAYAGFAGADRPIRDQTPGYYSGPNGLRNGETAVRDYLPSGPKLRAEPLLSNYRPTSNSYFLFATFHFQTWLRKSTYDVEKILKVAKLIPSDTGTSHELGGVIGKRSKKLLTPGVVWTCLKKVRSRVQPIAAKTNTPGRIRTLSKNQGNYVISLMTRCMIRCSWRQSTLSCCKSSKLGPRYRKVFAEQ
jgi:hypothetical protein